MGTRYLFTLTNVKIQYGQYNNPDKMQRNRKKGKNKKKSKNAVF